MKGEIELSEGELDLDKTMQCGQTFCWNKVSGAPLHEPVDDDASAKYYTTTEGKIVILWQDGNTLHYETNGELDKDPKELLRLHEPLDDVLNNINKDDAISDAIQQHRGIRLVQDEFVPCILSFVCEQQTNPREVKETFDQLVDKYGAEVEYNGNTFKQFPSLYELSNVSERELRRMGLGYRAKYVKSAIRHLIKGKVTERELKEMEYEEAHEEIQQINGVDDQVADNVLLSSLGFLEAFPLTPQAKAAVEEHYPEHHDDDYITTRDNLREYFGEYAGYAHGYLQHHAQDQ